MTTQNDGRERCERSRPISKTEFLDRQKLTQQPAHSQQLSETQTTCTRCGELANSLQLFAKLASPSAPVEVERLCPKCVERLTNNAQSTSGGKSPHFAKRAPLRVTWRIAALQPRRTV